MTAPSKMILTTLLVTPLDRALLDEFCRQDGDTPMAAVVRKLIRQEADRRGIDASNVVLATPEVEQHVNA